MRAWALPRLVVTEIKRHQRYLERLFNGYGVKRCVSSAGMPSCIDTPACCRLRRESLEVSALQLLGELAVLPPTLDARQWVLTAAWIRGNTVPAVVSNGFRASVN